MLNLFRKKTKKSAEEELIEILTSNKNEWVVNKIDDTIKAKHIPTDLEFDVFNIEETIDFSTENENRLFIFFQNEFPFYNDSIKNNYQYYVNKYKEYKENQEYTSRTIY